MYLYKQITQQDLYLLHIPLACPSKISHAFHMPVIYGTFSDMLGTEGDEVSEMN